MAPQNDLQRARHLERGIENDQSADAGAVENKKKELEETKASQPTLFAYAPALMVALLKDLLDLVGIGSLPAIGTVITICFSLLIFLLLLLTRANHKLIDARFIIKMGVVLLLGSIVEGFAFGLNFLPIETIVILIIYLMDKHFNDEQIEKITAALHLLHKGKGKGRSVKGLANEARKARAEARRTQREAAVSPMAATTRVPSQTPPLSSPSLPLHIQLPMPMMAGQGMAPSQPQRTMSDMHTPFLRKFSKQNSPEERSQAAQEIRGKRKEYFNRKADQDKKQEQKSELEQELEVLGGKIEAYNNGNLFQKINEYLSIRKVKAGLNEKSDLKKSLTEQLAEPEIGRPELDEARQMLRNFYDNEKKKWAEAPYAKEDIAENFSEEHLASLSLEDYALLMKRFPGQIVTHVTRRGVRDHYGMYEHHGGFGEASPDGFKGMLESKRLLSPLGVAISQAETYHDICQFLNHGRETITHRDVVDVDRQPTSIRPLIAGFKQYFDGDPTHRQFNDKAAIHVAVGQVLDGIYGSERGNEIFIAYPSAHIASQYNFLDVRGGVISHAGDSKHNDLYVWAENETTGMNIDAGIVFIPENAQVDAETGSLYRLDSSGKPIEVTTPKDQRESNTFYAEKTDQPIRSHDYWEQYFSQHPESRPSKIVYYNSNMTPTEALWNWKEENGIVDKKTSKTLGFDENAVGLDFQRPGSEASLRHLRQLSIDALIAEYGLLTVAHEFDPNILYKEEEGRQKSLNIMYHGTQ